MRFRFHLTNPAIFAMLWVALSALVLHDIALRRAAMAFNTVGTTVSDKVVTKEFVLVDDNGNTRARIGMIDKTGAPSVQLFDNAGQQRAQLRLNKNDVPSLRLYGNDGKVKSVLGFTLNNMEPAYVTFDALENGHVENMSRQFQAYLPFHDEDLVNLRGFNFFAGSQPSYPTTSYTTESSDVYLMRNAAAAQAAAAADQASQARAEAQAIRMQAQEAQDRAEAASRDPFRPNFR